MICSSKKKTSRNLQRKGNNYIRGGLCREKERNADEEVCAEEKRKEIRRGRGCSQNDNEEYHAN